MKLAIVLEGPVRQGEMNILEHAAASLAELVIEVPSVHVAPELFVRLLKPQGPIS